MDERLEVHLMKYLRDQAAAMGAMMLLPRKGSQ